jgi:hypothetical protein
MHFLRDSITPCNSFLKYERHADKSKLVLLIDLRGYPSSLSPRPSHAPATSQPRPRNRRGKWNYDRARLISRDPLRVDVVLGSSGSGLLFHGDKEGGNIRMRSGRLRWLSRAPRVFLCRGRRGTHART